MKPEKMKGKRIVIDARMLYWTGVGRYTQMLLDRLQKLDHENEYLVLVRQKDWSLWSPDEPNFRKVEADIDPYTVREQLRLPQLLRGLKPDIVHFTTPNTPLMYAGPRVVTIHDLTLLDFDTSRGRGVMKAVHELKRWPFRLVVFNDAKNATVITTAVNYVKQQLIKRYGVADSKIVVAPLGVATEGKKAASSEIEISGKYLLSVGNFYPYKNVGALIDAFDLLKTKRPDLKLVLVGKPDYFQEELRDQSERLGIQDRVVFTGFVPDPELIWLYSHAEIYVYPSLSEGFGLQGFEAMSRGVPVLAANASCLPEVYEDAAKYFDPRNPRDLASQIDLLLDDDRAREDLREKGLSQIRKFSWDDTARETLKAYQLALRS